MGNCASVSLSVKSDPSGPPLPHAITSLAPLRGSLQAPLLIQAGLLGAGREAPRGSVSGAVPIPGPTNLPTAAPAWDRPPPPHAQGRLQAGTVCVGDGEHTRAGVLDGEPEP